jgi:hypothetical protein
MHCEINETCLRIPIPPLGQVPASALTMDKTERFSALNVRSALQVTAAPRTLSGGGGGGGGSSSSSSSSKLEAISSSPFSQVLQSCRSFADPQQRAQLADLAVMSARAAEIQDSASPSQGMPLSFASEQEEAAFVILVQALRCGSGFDAVLAKLARGRSAHETVLFGLIGMYISNARPYAAEALNQASAHALSVALNVPIHESKQLEFAKLGGVYQDVDGPLKPFADLLCRQMHEMGARLRSRGCDTLADLLKPCTSAADVVDMLVIALPLTFADQFRPQPGGSGGGACFHAKAQRVAAELGARFRTFPDAHELTAFADAELVAALRYAGVMSVGADLAARIARGETLVNGGMDETALRVCAVLAVDALCTLAGVSAQAVQRHVVKAYVEACGSAGVQPPPPRQHLCQTAAY